MGSGSSRPGWRSGFGLGLGLAFGLGLGRLLSGGVCVVGKRVGQVSCGGKSSTHRLRTKPLSAAINIQHRIRKHTPIRGG